MVGSDFLRVSSASCRCPIKRNPSHSSADVGSALGRRQVADPRKVGQVKELTIGRERTTGIDAAAITHTVLDAEASNHVSHC